MDEKRNPIKIFRTAWLEKASEFMVNKEKMQELLAQIPTMLEYSGLKKVGKDLVALKDYVVEAISGQLENKDVKKIALAVAALIYVVTPLDIVSDFLPIIGFGDDAAIVAWAIKQLKDELL